MRLRLIVTGALGLLLALVWTMSFLYQRASLGFLVGVVQGNAPLGVTAAALWSVLQIWISGLLVLPVVLTSAGAMLGVPIMIRALRIMAAVGAVLSAGVLVIFAALSVLGITGPWLLNNPRIYYELLVAAGTLALQVALLMSSPRKGSDDILLGPNARTSHLDRGSIDKAPRQRDTQRAAMPMPSLSVAVDRHSGTALGS